MKNNLINLFLIFFLNFLVSFASSAYEQFNFDITEIEILNNGNIFIGKNGGTATSEDGTVIKAKNFEYDKNRNILIDKDLNTGQQDANSNFITHPNTGYNQGLIRLSLKSFNKPLGFLVMDIPVQNP